MKLDNKNFADIDFYLEPCMIKPACKNNICSHVEYESYKVCTRDHLTQEQILWLKANKQAVIIELLLKDFHASLLEAGYDVNAV